MPILKYDREAWTINKLNSNIISSAETWFFRRMEKISYTDRETKEEVLRIGEKRSLVRKISNQPSKNHWKCHKERESGTSGNKFEAKRSRGR